MSSESHYKSNLRDVEFNLFEVSDIGKSILGKGDFTTMDEATAKDTLAAMEKFARTEMAKSWAISDREPLKLDADGNVTLPAALTETLKQWFGAGWHMLEIPERLGGFGAPPSVVWAAFEMVTGANANAAFYQFGAFMARIIDRVGNDDQKARFVNNMLERHWGATMVLTEPDAGSDVGAGRATAKQIEGDVYELEGVKRFITNGDYDHAENVVHMVLARPEGAGPGTKGLSLFIVPKFWVNEDGSMGERNGVYVTNIEKKMGIKGSATCELTMGDRGKCRGLLAGSVHDGIRQMFLVIEHARMSIGVKSMSELSTAYLNALDYAKQRVQGPDLAKAADKTSPRVRIIEHPDVRRTLMLLKSYAEGLRALCFHAAHLQDQTRLADPSTDEAKAIDRRNDLLLPLVKGYSSEVVYKLLAQALQVFGGSGYCQDYPIEQYIRDQKIDTLYEGTTHIQALDLLFRKVARDQGATLQSLFADIQKTIDDEVGGAVLADERKRLLRGLQDVQGMYMAMMGKMGDSIYHAGFQANRILEATAELVIAWLLVQHAAIAAPKIEGANAADKPFYEGKVASAKFFCKNILPGLTLARKLVEDSDTTLMDVDESIF